jgi:hypothetical protein
MGKGGMSPWICLQGHDPGMYGINESILTDNPKRRLQRTSGGELPLLEPLKKALATMTLSELVGGLPARESSTRLLCWRILFM